MHLGIIIHCVGAAAEEHKNIAMRPDGYYIYDPIDGTYSFTKMTEVKDGSIYDYATTVTVEVDQRYIDNWTKEFSAVGPHTLKGEPQTMTVELRHKKTEDTNRWDLFINGEVSGDRHNVAIEAECAAIYTFGLSYDSNAGGDVVTGMPSEPEQVEQVNVDSYIFKLDSTAVPAREGHVFQGWAATPDSKDAITEVEGKPGETVTVYAIWADDANGDGIPDKYQVTVTYKVVNGYWNGGENDSADRTVVLTKVDEADSRSETGSAALGETIPAVGANPAVGYQPGAWAPECTAETTVEDNAVFVYTYQAGSFDYTVRYHYLSATGGEIGSKTENGTGVFGETIPYDNGARTYDREAYLFRNVEFGGSEGKISENTDNNTIDVYYDIDVIGESGEADGIADKYQVTILYWDDGYGSVSEREQIVTIMADGQPAESGAITAEAAATADEGYAFDYWSLGTSKVEGEVLASGRELTYGFEAKGGEVYEFTAHFGADVIGPDGHGDGIPDKYQKEVTYKVENGAWSGGGTEDVKQVVTFRDEKGSPSANGTAQLTPPALGQPDEGYITGAWDPELPESIGPDGPSEYTYSFKQDANGDDIADEEQGVVISIVGNNKTAVYTSATSGKHTVKGFTFTASVDGKQLTKEQIAAAGLKVEELVKDKTAMVSGSRAVDAEDTDGHTYYMGLTPESFTVTEGSFKNATVEIAEDGWLRIRRQSIDPEAKDTTYKDVVLLEEAPEPVTYDGQPHQWVPQPTHDDNHAWTLEEKTQYTYSYSRDGGETTTDDFTSAGTITVTITGEGDYKDAITRTYTISPKDASELTVTPPENVTYNGQSQQQKPTVMDGGKALVEGTDYVLEYSDDTTNAGEVTVTVKGMGNYAGAAETTYIIKRFTIELYANERRVYNGEEQTISFNSAIHTDQKKDIADHGNTLHASISGTDVGTYKDMEALKWSVTNEDGVDVSNNYTVKKQGTHLELTITPATLTVKAEDSGKRYGADDPELTYSVTGWQGDDANKGLLTDADITVTREEGEAVGPYPITPSGELELDNYTVEYEEGTFTIRPARIIPGNAAAVPPEESRDIITVDVTEPEDTTYNGTSQQQKPVIRDGDKELVEGVDYELSYSDDTTNAGEVTVTVKGMGNYTGEFTTTYNIGPRTVVMTSASAAKTFDNTPLRAQRVTVSGDNFAAGEGASYTFTGVRTAVGTARNTFNYTLNEGTDADNYTIRRVYGTLTVNAAPVVPAGPVAPAGPGPAAPAAPAGPAAPAAPADDAADDAVNIPDDETPLGEEPEELPEEEEPEEELEEPEEVEEPEDEGPDYILNEEVVIGEDETPLAGGPMAFSTQECCILHFILMLCALGVTLYFTHDRKKRQEREFELRSEL